MLIERRKLLLAAAFPTIASAASAQTIGPASAGNRDRIVQFHSEGLGLRPKEYGRLLLSIAEKPGIEFDYYSRGGVVAELEERMAKLLGKETAVFMPTGTLANHLAVRMLAGNRRRVLLQHESHLYNDSGDCAQQLSGLTLVPLAPTGLMFSLDDVVSEIERVKGGRVPGEIGAISIESPVRRGGHLVVDLSDMQKICDYARNQAIGLHLDGARLLPACAFTGIVPATYAALFDTVMVSLWKYLNAPSGAILAGPRRLLDNLYHVRRMFGGGMHNAWPDAAVALHYLGGFVDRYERAVAVATELFRMLAAHPRCRLNHPPGATVSADLKVLGANAGSLPGRLRNHAIEIPGARVTTAEGADFALVINESLLRRPAVEIIGAFAQALG